VRWRLGRCGASSRRTASGFSRAQARRELAPREASIMSRPRIALIHATPVAIDPIRDALAAGWPDAEPVNILDDSLSPDRAATNDLTDALTDRIVSLARYARGIGAAGVLFTCSAFGRAIEQAAVALDIP